MLPFFLFLYTLFPNVCAADLEAPALSTAKALNLSDDPTWKALIHYARGQCFVTDKTYYLSPTHCSLSEEIQALIRAIYSPDVDVRRDVACRFPARISFLRHRLGPYGIDLPDTLCPSFVEYTQRAPADTISLVFASENITHPMSMMGHVFLKFDGRSTSGIHLEHAASFFTQISSFNPAALVLDAFFFGMPAFFALTPYSEQIHSYRTIEGRSIFEYPLQASPFHLQLIHAHVWELRTIKSPYLFAGYNCATVVHFIIALANPELLDDLGRWISPIEVVRRAREKGIISERYFIPSLDWKARFYGQQLGQASATDVIKTLQTSSLENVRQITKSDTPPLLRAFAEALIEREQRVPRFFPERNEELSRIFLERTADSSIDFEVENLKDPTRGPNSPTITIGATRFNRSPYARFELLPVSHSLSDDNRHSYSESSLELGSASLLINPDEKRSIVLEKLNLYGMESLVPYDRYIGGAASRLTIGVQQEWDGLLSPYTAGHITAGLGRALQLGHDVTVYGLVNGAASYGDGRFMPSYFPEVGATIYEVLSMKTVANYRLVCGQHGAKGCYQSFNAVQSFLISDTTSPYLRFSNIWNEDRSTQVLEMGLRIHF